MTINIFRKLTRQLAVTPNFGVFYGCARKASCVFITLTGLLFCPWVAAQLIGQLQQQQVVNLAAVYHQYTVQLCAGLAVLLLIILL